jgi:hypothetical protein
MSPVKYELDFYIPVDDILHSHLRGNLKPYTRCENATGIYTGRGNATGIYTGRGNATGIYTGRGNATGIYTRCYMNSHDAVGSSIVCN